MTNLENQNKTHENHMLIPLYTRVIYAFPDNLIFLKGMKGAVDNTHLYILIGAENTHVNVTAVVNNSNPLE